MRRFFFIAFAHSAPFYTIHADARSSVSCKKFHKLYLLKTMDSHEKALYSANSLIKVGKVYMLLGVPLLALCFISLSLRAVAAIPMIAGFTMYGMGKLAKVGFAESAKVGKNKI